MNQKLHIYDPNLPRLARRINEREVTIENLKNKTVEHARMAVAEALFQGQDLIAAKARVPYGLWIDWLKSHCPKSVDTAQRYMKLAANSGRVHDLDQANSLRAALALIGQATEEGERETKQWPPFLEAISRISKFTGYLERHPINQWPQEGRDKLREELLPIASGLWPERFSSILTNTQ